MNVDCWRILVTGGAGFIGSHLCRRLISLGYEITIIDNLSTGFMKNVPPEARFLKLDLTGSDFARELPAGPYEGVCHLAGQASGEKSFEDPLYDLDANARSTLLLARWALENGVPTFVHASSMGVYGEVRNHPVKEVTAVQPISYYGSSKYSAERILQVASRQGLRTVSLRMFNVYGPGQNLADNKQGMVSIYLAQLLKGEPLVVKGSLDRIRDFVYVDDVVTAWEMALKKPVSGVFNVGSGLGIEVRTLIAELLAACKLERNYPVHEQEGTPGDLFAVSADISAIKGVLGWAPRVSLREGLTRMVEWARSRQRTPLSI